VEQPVRVGQPIRLGQPILALEYAVGTLRAEDRPIRG
jgi:hypothetical protein